MAQLFSPKCSANARPLDPLAVTSGSGGYHAIQVRLLNIAHTMRLSIVAVSASTLVVSLAGCQNDATPAVPRFVSVAPVAASIDSGFSLHFRAQTIGVLGSSVSDARYQWTFDPAYFRCVEEKCRKDRDSLTLQAVGAGASIVEVVADGIKATSEIAILSRPIDSLVLSYQTPLLIGDSVPPMLSAFDAKGARLASPAALRWTSSDGVRVGVSTDGWVSARAAGTAMVTAASDSALANVAVRVLGSVTGAFVDDTVSLLSGDVVPIPVRILADSGIPRSFEVTSSNPDIARISSRFDSVAGRSTGVAYARLVLNATARTADSVLVRVRDGCLEQRPLRFKDTTLFGELTASDCRGYDEYELTHRRANIFSVAVRSNVEGGVRWRSLLPQVAWSEESARGELNTLFALAGVDSTTTVRVEPRRAGSVGSYELQLKTDQPDDCKMPFVALAPGADSELVLGQSCTLENDRYRRWFRFALSRHGRTIIILDGRGVALSARVTDASFGMTIDSAAADGPGASVRHLEFPRQLPSVCPFESSCLLGLLVTTRDPREEGSFRVRVLVKE